MWERNGTYFPPHWSSIKPLHRWLYTLETQFLKHFISLETNSKLVRRLSKSIVKLHVNDCACAGRVVAVLCVSNGGDHGCACKMLTFSKSSNSINCRCGHWLSSRGWLLLGSTKYRHRLTRRRHTKAGKMRSQYGDSSPNWMKRSKPWQLPCR